jgi:hypothetical protein
MTFVHFNSRPLNTVHALYAWVPPRVHVPVVTCPVHRTYVSRLRTYLPRACTSLSARTWARPAARRRLCDLPKVRRAREEVIKEVTSHSIKKHTCAPPSLRLTFTTARFAGAPSSDGLAGVGAVGVSRSRRAPGYHFTCGASPISGPARAGGIRSDNLLSVVISSCSATRSLTRRRTRRTGTHSALDRCPPLPAPACPCPLCALRRRSHRA